MGVAIMLQKRLYKLFVALIIIFSFTQSVLAEDSIVIETKGKAYLGGDGLVNTEKKAINDGLRRAVEQAVGTFISSSTMVKNARLIEDKILKSSQGYVKGYQVIDQSIDDDIYIVKLKVRVGTKVLADDLDALKLNIKRIGNPRVMVLISQEMDDYYVKLPDSLAETEMMNKFIESGFQVIDRYKIDSVINREERRSIISGDYNLAVKLGIRLKADFVVIGSIRSNYIDLRNTLDGIARSLKSYNAQVEARVINATTAQVIAAVTDDGKGVGINKEMAAKKSIIEATGNITDKLINKMSNDLIQQEKTIQLQINGISSLSQLGQIKRTLPTLSGVVNVFFREFGNELLTFDIDLEPAVEVFDIAIELEEKVPFSFEIKNMSERKLILEVK
jgi:curli biogenesis system outer membrane secretion channel CsgG